MNAPTLLLGLIALLGSTDDLPALDAWDVAPQVGGGGGRVLFAADPVLLKLADDPEFLPESRGRVTREENGRVAHAVLGNGWAFTTFTCERARTVLVEGRGFHSLFVNGDRFPGDFYRQGTLRMPIPLRKGENRLLVRAIRGDFTIELLPAEGPCSLSPRDRTVPDLRSGVLIDRPGAAIVLNHTTKTLASAFLEVGDGRVFERMTVPVPPILPSGFRKTAFPMKQLRTPTAEELDAKGRYRLPLTLLCGTTHQTDSLPLAIRMPGDAYVETRLSGIDGSVQYHAVRPPEAIDPNRTYALTLSLHGAGVRAPNQARSYLSKKDGFVVAPTNRRPFGFDWQEWGRLDALETLEFAMAEYPIDPERVYLTGHSMGGHGTWYLGTLYPSKFAAIAPSAGWASFFTYGGGLPRKFGTDPDLEPFARAQLESDTMAMVENLADTPVYILHGDKDDNVPLREAKAFVKRLGEFHRDFTWHYQPGAGHWWGSECVDWVPLFEFCRRHRLVEKPLRFRFTTCNPAVASDYAWVRIDSQSVPMRASTVGVEVYPRKREIRIATENVEELVLEDPWSLFPLLQKGMPQTRVVIDGEALNLRIGENARLYRSAGETGERGWALSRSVGYPAGKSAVRSGPFKLAFDRAMVFVYGTKGTPEENAATLAAVRYHAGVWWYRGNGDVTVVPDRDFSPERFPSRNVILFGNADTNDAFATLLPDCPVAIARGKVTVGDRVYEDDLGLCLTYPHPDYHRNLVGVVGATSARVMRMSQQARHFVSGAACPDWAVWSEDTLLRGMEGVVRSGFFTNDWELAR